MDDQVVKKLIEIVGKNNVSTATADKITHAYDATQQKYFPEVVVYANSTEAVQRIVQLANAEKIPVFPRGAGSGFTGGSLPIHGGIVLVLTRMDKILDIDEDNLTAEVEPGVVTAFLQRAVEKRGLFYPPDPASKDFSTLGGNVAENAGGPRCVKYGVTRDYILGLEVVTPKGDVITTGGKTLKNVVAYDEESEKIWQVRRMVSPSLRKIGPDKFNEDIVMPRSKIPDMIQSVSHVRILHAFVP